MEKAPVILFAYKRPEHTLKTLRALQTNVYADESSLIVYIDGPKPDASETDKALIRQVGEVVRSGKWCRDIQIIERETNYGLAKSVSGGVTEVLERYGKAIIIEDDIVTGKYFLEFMNRALEKYEHQQEVACISGYIYPVKGKLPEAFFIKGSDCWGWATWSRAWDMKNWKAEDLLQKIESRQLSAEFDFGNTYPYVQMLKDRIEGRNNSWAILWYAAAFLNNQLCLYPGKSVANNIGIDGSGTHSGVSDAWNNTELDSRINLDHVPVKEDLEAKKVIADYFKTLNPVIRVSLLRRVLRKLKSLIR
ncbi:MAG: glycosyltransferase family 2 protein [Bacteroidetes bacterium]|nr:glycosyltransferase family 2 protein [Bacteroidota bacterium]